MEFERALFRIHQRTLQSHGSRKFRLQAELVLPWIIGVLALSLFVLHSEYVGQARCLPGALRRAGLWNETTDSPAFPEDAVMGLFLAEGDEIVDLELQMDPLPVRPALHVEEGKATVQQPGFSVVAENASTVHVAASEAVGHWLEPVPDPSRLIVEYRFAFDREIAAIRPKVFNEHRFRMHNITIHDRCLAPSLLLSAAFRVLDGWDSIIINELAYTFRSRGFLDRVEGHSKVESWVWFAEQVEAISPKHGRFFLAAVVRKLLIVLRAMGAFVLISAMTGFFIRVAVNGSAVLMFPIAFAAQACGSNRMSMAVLTRSFPWIGLHVEVLRRAQRPLWPLFRSHLFFLFLQSFAYLSCNITWRFVIYQKSYPEGFEERVFSLCSLLELFSLIFVRSANSIAVFPRLVFASVVYLHFYVFASLYPFHSMALALCTSCCFYVMAYCLNHFEEPALRADPFAHTTPTAAHPRALYMPQLSPSWSLESAPLWTMFYVAEPPSAYPPEAMRNISDEEYLMA